MERGSERAPTTRREARRLDDPARTPPQPRRGDRDARHDRRRARSVTHDQVRPPSASEAAPRRLGRRLLPRRRPPARKPNKFMADLTKAMQAAAETARDRHARALQRRCQGPHRGHPRQHRRRGDRAAQAGRRRRRRHPRLVEGRDRAHPRGDRRAHRASQGRRSSARSRPMPPQIEARIERVQRRVAALRGRDGRLLRAPARRG